MANFEKFLPRLSAIKNGFNIDSTDSYNFNSDGQLVGSNYGINPDDYEEAYGSVPTRSQMQNLSIEQAKSIYKNKYWDMMRANEIKNQSVAELLIDFAVQTTRGDAVEEMQKVLNANFNTELVVDGLIGKNTIAAINKVDQKKLHQLFLEHTSNVALKESIEAEKQEKVLAAQDFNEDKSVMIVTVIVSVLALAGLGYLYYKRTKKK